MPDWKSEIRKAGPNPSRPPWRDNRGGGGGSGSSPNAFPRGYPQYFTADGHTRVELLKEEAEGMAERFKDDGLTRNQLRGFYDHAKKQLQRLRYGALFGEIHPEVVRLKYIAADRAERRTIPPSFKQFIDRNIDAVTDEKSFRNGFMPHFEAVVAYSARIRD